MRTSDFKSLPDIQKRLVDAASQARETAYCPYSHFAVGAALLTTDDEIITGSNVENAAYGSSICAERAALVRANAMGKREFECIAVVAGGKDAGTAVAPCGACRQMLYELCMIAGRDIGVILSDGNKNGVMLTSVKELLPMGFGPDVLA